jgi:PAS domain S-box-containing protein
MALSLVVAVVAYRSLTKAGAASLLVMAVSALAWSASSSPGAAAAVTHPLAVRALAAILALSAVMTATSGLTFALSVTNNAAWHTPRLVGLLAVVPIFTQVLIWAAPDGTLASTATAARSSWPLSGGPWYAVLSPYSLLLCGAGLLALASAYGRTGARLHHRSWVILAGAAAPFVLAFIALAFPGMPFPLEAGYGGFVLCAIGFAYGLVGPGSSDAVPIARQVVVDHMQDGWIILDVDDKIADINPAAEALLGLRRQDVYGQPIRAVLSDFPSLTKAFDGVQELEMRRSVKSQENWRYLNIRITPMTDRRGNLLGRLIVWSDNTKHRLAEDARHRARDEMFVLLNAISSAASHTIELEDFLSEATYQIIFPFRSQLVAIFLLDDGTGKSEQQRLYLASHLGLSEEMAESLAYLPAVSPLMSWLTENGHPLAIEDLDNDARTPSGLQGMDFTYLLVSPLIAPGVEDGRIIGILCLARKDKLMYSADELVRVTAVSDQIATLVDSSRRRKLTIALSERRSLMRDLHDSVSQRLYGLVAITEAAQAALEAGEKVDPPELLARIGEHARQAVREMRLFLYQIRPIDVEKEGIIAVLHHRLAAVEGRANLKARLLADEDIPLSKDKEVALYFISQEALNNIMKHAYAKSVLVTLKRGKQNVILEVRDDGKGFDPRKADTNGMGLRNMKERTAQIGGKLKVTSKPGHGTRIVITVPAEKPARPVARRRSA